MDLVLKQGVFGMNNGLNLQSVNLKEVGVVLAKLFGAGNEWDNTKGRLLPGERTLGDK